MYSKMSCTFKLRDFRKYLIARPATKLRIVLIVLRKIVFFLAKRQKFFSSLLRFTTGAVLATSTSVRRTH